MAELLKNIYHQKFFNRFLSAVADVVPHFDNDSFLTAIFDQDWDNKELKQRMRHITIVFQEHLSDSFPDNAKTIVKLLPVFEEHGFRPDNLEFIFLPDFIELYGMEDYETSIWAFENITQFVTCEFGVRPFIIQYPNQMTDQMFTWSKHSHPSVRRLATEGFRPRLPWAIALPFVKENPAPILPILKHLKNDASESVRRSVANNLNDISKDNPNIVKNIVGRWQGESTNIDRIIKHACRTMLKQGDPEVMQLFGFGSVDDIKLRDFVIQSPIVKIGNHLEFSYQLINKSDEEIKIRLEYGMYYKKANNTLSRKVFTISEKIYAPNSFTKIIRKQSFKIITTRKYYPGTHKISIILNGIEMDQRPFELIL